RRARDLFLSDVECCIAALKLRPVVCGQRGPVDLVHRRAEGGLPALLKAHLAPEIPTVLESADCLGRTFKAPVEYRDTIAARQIEVSELYDYGRSIGGVSGVRQLISETQGENHDRCCEAIHGSLLIVCRVRSPLAVPDIGPRRAGVLCGVQSQRADAPTPWSEPDFVVNYL